MQQSIQRLEPRNHTLHAYAHAGLAEQDGTKDQHLYVLATQLSYTELAKIARVLQFIATATNMSNPPIAAHSWHV